MEKAYSDGFIFVTVSENDGGEGGCQRWVQLAGMRKAMTMESNEKASHPNSRCFCGSFLS